MKPHIDALGWLHSFWGAFGALTGVSLWILALGTYIALGDLGLSGPAGMAAVWILVLCGGTLALGGVLMAVAGRALRQRRPAGRLAILLLAAPNLILVPFGTALGIYAIWVLLNDEARTEFGRPARGPSRIVS